MSEMTLIKFIILFNLPFGVFNLFIAVNWWHAFSTCSSTNRPSSISKWRGLTNAPNLAMLSLICLF